MAVAERQDFESLRANVQRKLAAQMDLGTPDPAPEPAPRVERADPPPPRMDRRRMDSLRSEVQNNATVQVDRRRSGGFMGRRQFRLRLSPKRLLLVLTAVVAGGLAAWLATQHDPGLAPAVAQPVTQVVHEARTQILVAKQAIGIGERLTAASVEWQDWPQGAVRPEYITVAATPNATTDMAGAVARFEFFPGEPIRKEKLALPGDGYLSAVLASGMRGVSVSVDAAAASGGFVVPNDHVDVALTRSTDQRTETILHNVRVLAINTRLGEKGATGGTDNPDDPRAQIFKDQAIATLELNPTQADVIINAAAVGKLSLELRALTDFAKAGLGDTNATQAAIRISSPFWTGGTGPALQSVH